MIALQSASASDTRAIAAAIAGVLEPGDVVVLDGALGAGKTLFVQGRGELRRELTRCLRTGRAKRLPRAWTGNRRRMIPNMVMISERPAEVADRAVPGTPDS